MAGQVLFAKVRIRMEPFDKLSPRPLAGEGPGVRGLVCSFQEAAIGDETANPHRNPSPHKGDGSNLAVRLLSPRPLAGEGPGGR